MWEWVPHRRPSEPSGRTSRASVRSVLSRATGGLLGGAAGRSTRSGSTPGSSPRDARERGFLASSGGNGASEEGPGLAPRQYGPAGEVDVADGVGPSTPLLGVESPGPSSPEPPSRTPRVHYSDFHVPPLLGPAFDDVDLTSPRPDARAHADDNGFGAPREMQETSTRPLALPILPPITATNGALRLSTMYDPPVITQLPPSPSSYEPPPLGAPLHLAVSNGDSDDSSSRSDGHKRDTRLGYLSWTHGGAESDNERAVSGYGPELTPPQTPEDEGLGLRVVGEDEDSLEGGPMLSTQPSAMRRSFSSELSETGVPDSALFLNGASSSLLLLRFLFDEHPTDLRPLHRPALDRRSTTFPSALFLLRADRHLVHLVRPADLHPPTCTAQRRRWRRPAPTPASSAQRHIGHDRLAVEVRRRVVARAVGLPARLAPRLPLAALQPAALGVAHPDRRARAQRRERPEPRAHRGELRQRQGRLGVRARIRLWRGRRREPAQRGAEQGDLDRVDDGSVRPPLSLSLALERVFALFQTLEVPL